MKKISNAILCINHNALGQLDFTSLGLKVIEKRYYVNGYKSQVLGFADGTTIEFMSVSSRQKVEHSFASEDDFVLRIENFRFRFDQGVSILQLISDDKTINKASHQFFPEYKRSINLSYNVNKLSNEYIAKEYELRGDLRAYNATFMLSTENKLAAYQYDTNVIGIVGAVLTDENPSDFQYMLQQIAGIRSIKSTSIGISAVAGKNVIAITDDNVLKSVFKIPVLGVRDRGPVVRAIVLRVKDLKAIKIALQDADNVHQVNETTLVVWDYKGINCALIFISRDQLIFI